MINSKIQLMNCDLTLTFYGTAMLDIEFLKDIPFNYLILDEAQAIKNPLSQRFKAMTMISAKYHLALTGTPVENPSTDLYALLSFANPGFFGSLKMFNDHMISKGDEEDDLRKQQLLKTINPFILRRTKDKVATDLPPKTEMVLWCEMEPAQRRIYDACRKKFKDHITEKIDTEGLENSKLYILDGLMKLRQICNSPSLVKDAHAYSGESCKIEELMVHITEKTGEHKVLVFSQFTGMLQLIQERLMAEGIGHVYLNGKTAMISGRKLLIAFRKIRVYECF